MRFLLKWRTCILLSALVLAGACAVSLPSDQAGLPPTVQAVPEDSPAYATLRSALEAGDTAAFLGHLEGMARSGTELEDFRDTWLALARAAAGDFADAYVLLDQSRAQDPAAPAALLVPWLEAWFLALEGQPELAVERHSRLASRLPGITAELSLAALLEACGRPEEALAVYSALTPARIQAPEHDFDPQGLVFGHVRTVVTRHSLLLQRLGRSEQAQSVYRQLAEAQPEQHTAHAAALAQLATGEGLDNPALTLASAFARSVADVAAALQQQRYIEAAMLGLEVRGFDSQRAAFDQMSLLLDPGNEAIRLGLVDALYQAGHFAGAARVALSAPSPGPALEISAAQALVMTGQPEQARAALARALSDPDGGGDLQTLFGAAQISTLIDDEAQAMALIGQIETLPASQAETAAAHGVAASIHAHFGRLEEAVDLAGMARQLDDTHERRLQLADLLARAGRGGEALQLFRAEWLSRPDDPYTLNALGYFLIRHTDRLEEGYRVLARALMLAGSDPYISDSFGWALYLHGNLDQARGLIEDARDQLLPLRHWEIEDHLGDILWHQGDPAAARMAWQRALEQFPPHVERELIRDKLASGLSRPRPERRPLPTVRIDDGAERRQEI